MGPDAGRLERDYASYRLLVELWAKENPVKTAKLLALLVVNALLVAALSLGGGLVPGNRFTCTAGAAFSLVFFLSLGRTTLFQEAWRLRIRDLALRHPGDPRFQILEGIGERERLPPMLRVAGAVPSAYYLVGAPVLLLLFWVAALVWTLA